jgi:hypothetical protein
VKGATSMSDEFRQAYAALTEFIAAHPEIEIGESVASIPGDVRQDFYDLFNAVRNAFIEEKFPQYVSTARTLKSEYDSAAEEASAWLALEEAPVASHLRRFLQDPSDSLTRELFDPLFDLLKKRETEDTFAIRASDEIETLFPIVYRGGYEKWMLLALANLLQVHKAFRVPVREQQPGDRSKSAAYAPAEEVPLPVESDRFLFSQSSKAIFAAPDFIVYSSALNKYVGVRSEFRPGIYNAMNPNPEREWQPLDTDLLILLESGLALVYITENLESIALVSDVAKLCRPDLALLCVDTQTMTQNGTLEKIAMVEDRLRPTRGSYVIVNDSWPPSDGPANSTASDASSLEETSKARVLTVGFDRSKLLPVVEALRDAESPATT